MSMGRREFLTAGLALAAAGTLGYGVDYAVTHQGGGSTPNAPNHPSEGSTGTVSPSPTEIPVETEFGIAMSDTLFLPLTAAGNYQVQTRMATAANTLGARVLRVDIDGNLNHPNRTGPYDWRYTDRIVDTAQRLGVPLIATVAFVPPWNRNPKGRGDYEELPSDPQDFLNSTGAIVGRYGDIITDSARNLE